jgi:hypothetical protein
MRAFINKYWRRLRYTEDDADRHLRLQCIAIAGQYQPKNTADLLRGAQLIYEWVTVGKLMIEGAPPPSLLRVAE